MKRKINLLLIFSLIITLLPNFTVYAYTQEECLEDTHNWEYKETVVEQSSDVDRIVLEQCSICGKCRTRVSPTEDYPCSQGHDWQFVDIIQDSTYYSDAVVALECSVCGKTSARVDASYNSSPCTHHEFDYENAEVISEATCNSQAIIRVCCHRCKFTTTIGYGSVLDHHEFERYEDGDKEPTCSLWGYNAYKCKFCSQLRYDDVDPTGHDWGEWLPESEGVPCTEFITMKRVCSVCGEEEHRVSAITGDHNLEYTHVDATCQRAGYTSVDCTLCGYHREDPDEDGILGEHAYGEWKVKTAASCFGNEIDIRDCTVCGHREERVVGDTALQHIYEETSSVDSTCVEYGKRYYKCTLCGDMYSEDISPKGHSYGEWTEIQAPTCGAKGLLQRRCTVCDDVETKTVEATGEHNWVTDSDITTCTHLGYTRELCSVCGAEKDGSRHNDTEFADHNWDEGVSMNDAICGRAGHIIYTCKECKTQRIETDPDSVPDHDWSDWTSNGDATCTTNETRTRYCRSCNAIQTNFVSGSMLPHEYEEQLVDPTCTSSGYTIYTCKICNNEIITNFIPATSHVWGEGVYNNDATCISKGTVKYECEICGQEKTEYCTDDAVEYGDHVYAEVLVPASCTLGEHTISTCVYCGHSETTEAENLLSHDWGDWETEVEATCMDGLAKRVCRKCNAVEYKIVAASGDHDWEITTEIEASCESDGQIIYSCTNCNSSKTEITQQQLGHDYVLKDLKESSCVDNGCSVYECSRCGNTMKVDLPLSNLHNHSKATVSEVNGDTAKIVYVCEDCKKELYSIVIPVSEISSIVEDYNPDHEGENPQEPGEDDAVEEPGENPGENPENPGEEPGENPGEEPGENPENPEEPGENPENPENPETPGEEPENPSEEPGNPSENPSENPENPGDIENPENPGENPGEEPENPSENPGEEPENPSENPENPSDKPETPSENPENPSDKPGDDTGGVENPSENPETPGDVENPSENPENPSEKPSDNPENPSEKPETPSEKPETPSEKPETPSENPEKPSENPSENPEKPSENPGSSFGGTVNEPPVIENIPNHIVQQDTTNTAPPSTVGGSGNTTAVINSESAVTNEITTKVNAISKTYKSKKIGIKWNKKSGVSGYQIQVSTSKKFTKSKTLSKVISGASKKSVTLNCKNYTNLVKAKTIYVRIRTFKISKGKKIYSKWSLIKSKKIKVNSANTTTKKKTSKSSSSVFSVN